MPQCQPYVGPPVSPPISLSSSLVHRTGSLHLLRHWSSQAPAPAMPCLQVRHLGAQQAPRGPSCPGACARWLFPNPRRPCCVAGTRQDWCASPRDQQCLETSVVTRVQGCGRMPPLQGGYHQCWGRSWAPRGLRALLPQKGCTETSRPSPQRPLETEMSLLRQLHPQRLVMCAFGTGLLWD